MDSLGDGSIYMYSYGRRKTSRVTLQYKSVSIKICSFGSTVLAQVVLLYCCQLNVRYTMYLIVLTIIYVCVYSLQSWRHNIWYHMPSPGGLSKGGYIHVHVRTCTSTCKCRKVNLV